MNAGKLDALSHILPTLVIHVQNYSWTGLFPVKHRWNRKEWWQGCFLLCVKYSGIYPCHRYFSVQQNIHWNGTIVQKEMLVNLHLLRISNHPKKNFEYLFLLDKRQHFSPIKNWAVNDLCFPKQKVPSWYFDSTIKFVN